MAARAEAKILLSTSPVPLVEIHRCHYFALLRKGKVTGIGPPPPKKKNVPRHPFSNKLHEVHHYLPAQRLIWCV